MAREREKILNFRVSAPEFYLVRALAAQRGETVSEYLRAILAREIGESVHAIARQPASLPGSR